MNTEYSLFLKKVFTLLFIAVILWVLYTINSVVVIVLLSGFLGILMNPLVTLMQQKRVPAWLTVTVIYILVLILIFFVIGTLVPLIIQYISIGISGFIKWIQNVQLIYSTEGVAGFHLPSWIEGWLNSLLGGNALDGVLELLQANIKEIQLFLTEQAKNITTGTFNIGSSVIGFISTFIFVGITTFLLVLDRKAVGNFVLDVLPENLARYCTVKFREIEEILGSWIRGQIVLGFSIYITTLIGLTLVEWFMGVTFERKGTIALIAGIMEFVPYLGPIISAIPALVVALSISWEVTLVTLVLYIAIQQLENNVFVPIIMSKSLDLSPFYIFIVMVAGGMLAGILGIILAVPVAAIMQKLATDLIQYKKSRSHSSSPITTTPIEKKEKVPPAPKAKVQSAKS